VKPDFERIISLGSKTLLNTVDRFRLRFDQHSSYIVMPEGVWRGPAFLVPGANVIPLKLPPGEIENFYVEGEKWFLLKEPDKDGRVFLCSDDYGSTWHPMDDGLEVEVSGRKSRLVATRMTWQGDVCFLNAGGGINFLSSRDGGKHWTVLMGSIAVQMASPGQFLVREHDALLGGEAPLDVAYLRKGRLRTDASGWSQSPRSVAPAGIENRNVQFIEANQAGTDLFAGVEGGLLKSTDGGDSWRWVQRFVQGDRKYPYIQHICFASPPSERVWVGGFDKPNDSLPYLSMSEDDGETWDDLSAVVAVDPHWRDVLAVQEDPAGRVIVVVFDVKARHIEVGELVA
jgi:photosystem II stability/assembly factor-like uncharacterized protein